VSVNSDNFTLLLSRLKSGIFDTDPPHENLIHSLIDDLRIFNTTHKLIKNPQNIDSWRSKQKIPMKRGSVALPLIAEYLGNYNVWRKRDERSAELYDKLRRFLRELMDEKKIAKSASINKNIFVQSKAIKITTPISAQSQKLTKLTSALSGMYRITRYRFNKPSTSYPKIAQELMYIYPGPDRENNQICPHFTLWYRRNQTTLREIWGVGYLAGASYWFHGFDDIPNFRTRVISLTGEDDLNEDAGDTDPIASSTRGGIMLSDTQDTNNRFPVACRFIMERIETDLDKELMAPNYNLQEFRKFAEHHVQFIEEGDLPSAKRQLVLSAIDNGNGNFREGRNVLLMPQDVIDDISHLK